jgi:hypothetical protein
VNPKGWDNLRSPFLFFEENMERIGEEKKMSVKEVADAIGYESETIRKKVKELFPEIVENGKPTMLSEKQVFIIRNNLFPRTPAWKSGDHLS